ncbi:hypothetical protein SCARR_02926 [Pontiella sulfatireligans]|uniref:Uncharacterized protein n=1 Tax=Pontiella sulfatireligans TaxID=2750658 RepID=A0A6C2ULL2_9BACT|nr:hypothetical protein SCARR_02926 [Pontiella sulfatireligans]
MQKKRLFQEYLLFGGNHHYFGGKNQAGSFGIWENVLSLGEECAITQDFKLDAGNGFSGSSFG